VSAPNQNQKQAQWYVPDRHFTAKTNVAVRWQGVVGWECNVAEWNGGLCNSMQHPPHGWSTDVTITFENRMIRKQIEDFNIGRSKYSMLLTRARDYARLFGESCADKK